jgi:hypothetical protein
MTFKTLEDLRKANRAAGETFFDEPTRQIHGGNRDWTRFVASDKTTGKRVCRVYAAGYDGTIVEGAAFGSQDEALAEARAGR